MGKKSPPLSRKPKKQKNLSADAFINAAEEDGSPQEIPVTKTVRVPWNESRSRFRADVSKVFNLRIPEPDFQKLKYLSKTSGSSMHKICLDALLMEIDQKLNALTQK